MRRTTVITTLLASLVLPACAHNIKGTQIEDNEENRTLYGIIEEVRAALEARDGQKLLTHVSPNYFEDNGNADASDDYGYEELVKKFVPQSFEATKEMHLALEVLDIVVSDDRAYAELRYASRARIALPANENQWDSHKELNRIEFAVEDGAWRIVSGL